MLVRTEMGRLLTQEMKTHARIASHHPHTTLKGTHQSRRSDFLVLPGRPCGHLILGLRDQQIRQALPFKLWIEPDLFCHVPSFQHLFLLRLIPPCHLQVHVEPLALLLLLGVAFPVLVRHERLDVQRMLPQLLIRRPVAGGDVAGLVKPTLLDQLQQRPIWPQDVVHLDIMRQLRHPRQVEQQALPYAARHSHMLQRLALVIDGVDAGLDAGRDVRGGDLAVGGEVGHQGEGGEGGDGDVTAGPQPVGFGLEALLQLVVVSRLLLLQLLLRVLAVNGNHPEPRWPPREATLVLLMG
mmetsp:Transcript_50673/g.127103  ORF Transcript_50673/g.127103 Transcript_50673/m.127103 type:complete len:296 (+) Transcript_50673:530-1417(+)